MKNKKIRIYIVTLSLIILIISLTQSAITINRYYSDTIELEPQPSLGFFLGGSIGILGGAAFEEFIWLANPLCIISIMMFLDDKKKSITFSLIALAIAVSFSFWDNILANEGGGTTEIVSFDAGYYLWVLSIAILNIGIFLYYKKIQENVPLEKS